MAKNLIGEVIGRQFHEVFSNKFFTRALNRKSEIELKLEEVSKEFFPEMAGMIGGESAPPELSTKWSPLSEAWVDRKSVVKGSRDLKNQFYDGITNDITKFRFQLGLNSYSRAFGSPEVTIGTLRAVGKFKGGDQRINPAKVSVKDNILRYAGSFRAVDQIFRVDLGFDPYPNVQGDEDLLDGLNAASADIIEFNEGRWGNTKAPRPFLVPMMEYYARTKMRKAFMEVVSR